ncbi:MAG: glycosyltransferase family A protein [Bacteroidales bacterium]|nr:glycosyltransferase family A protein [Bacteroidales bacterium]
MTSEIKSPLFTVFTPVFNGEQHIHRVFKSITEQHFRDFEWIIINDGSTDNTATLVKSFLAEHPEIDAVYQEQPNAGKHISWNKAVELARGKLFVPADADDYFFPETLSYFFEKWNNLTPGDQTALSGINVLCLDNDSETVVGDSYPVDGMRTNNVQLEFGINSGEKWGCVRTDLLKSRPFQE